MKFLKLNVSIILFLLVVGCDSSSQPLSTQISSYEYEGVLIDCGMPARVNDISLKINLQELPTGLKINESIVHRSSDQGVYLLELGDDLLEIDVLGTPGDHVLEIKLLDAGVLKASFKGKLIVND